MSSFVSKSACKGRRPAHLVGFGGFQRQGLITRLLKERGVARFIVAPDGYGKTVLATDYAETVFSWVHTFFVNCQSPCFLRDLDEEMLASSLLGCDDKARLVVFDALPALEGTRVELFSREVDALLAAECEVIVTCTPTSDALGLLQGDQLRLGGADLLLSDEELDAVRSVAERAKTPSALLPDSRRVPALVWGEGSGVAVDFLKRVFQEPMPADLMLAMASMYVIGAGSLSELEGIGPIDLSLVEQLLESYPHLCFDRDIARFDAPGISAEAVGTALKGKMADLVARSESDTREGLVDAWADALIQEGRPERACDVVRAMCPRSRRANWLSRRAFALVGSGCFLPALKLARSASTKAVDVAPRDRAVLSALEALCLCALGEGQRAATCAKRVVSKGDAPPDARVYCLTLLVRFGADAVRRRAKSELVAIAGGADGPKATEAALIARAWLAVSEGPYAVGQVFAQLADANARPDTLGLVASWLFDAIDSEADPGSPVTFAHISEGAARAELCLREAVEAEGEVGLDFVMAMAALSMERAHMRGVLYTAGPLSTASLLTLRQVELSLLSQKQQLGHSLDAGGASGWPEGGSEIGAEGAVPVEAVSANRSVPVLEIKMFGCFDVSIGGLALDRKLFRRRNVRSLLVLLAINQGRDMPRESIIASIWPEADEETARKNFYSIWSLLKRALTLTDGTCPYLVRHQYGCRLEERYVRSDVARLSQICRELLFGRPDMKEWSELYAELDRDFADDLMPSETDNPLILRARSDYRMRMVDALVAASLSVAGAGNPLWGIWFARMACDRDRTREDAYVALMKAQIAADQRTAAIMTFLKCQRVLAEELGVDPSAETVALYESLLD